jgi:hypothetical protein
MLEACGLNCSVRCTSGADTLPSSLGAFGAFPKARSRSSPTNSRLAGIAGALFSPGLTHCMLFGPPAIGTRGPEKGGRSGPGYIDARGAMGFARSALGPVGILIGAFLGEVLTEMAFRGPEGMTPGEASLAWKGGGRGLEKDGDTLARKAAWGPVGGGRFLARGTCGRGAAGGAVDTADLGSTLSLPDRLLAVLGAGPEAIGGGRDGGSGRSCSVGGSLFSWLWMSA